MRWKGKIFTGEGKAAGFLELKPYRLFIENSLGFRPYPGTLNLRGDSTELTELKQRVDSISKDKFRYEGESFGGLTLYPVLIGDKKAAIVEPERTRYGDKVAEIVAESNLRNEMALSDGETVFLSLLKD